MMSGSLVGGSFFLCFGCCCLLGKEIAVLTNTAFKESLSAASPEQLPCGFEALYCTTYRAMAVPHIILRHFPIGVAFFLDTANLKIGSRLT
jgi:hypothetical protein